MGVPAVENRLQGEFNHPAVGVPSADCPFSSADDIKMFSRNLQSAWEAGDVPEGYGLVEGEDGFNVWNPTETLKCGRRRGGISVSLPEHIWLPRVRLWITALEGLACTLDSQ